MTTKAVITLDSDEKDTITFTCVPVGSGQRIALDRNENGVLDGDEN